MDDANENEDAIDIEFEDKMTLAESTTFSVPFPKNRMWTLNEAAEYLGVQPDTLRQQAGRGVLRAEKRGRDWLVSPLEVERYAAQHRRIR